MSNVPGTRNQVIGRGGVAITALSVLAYATTTVGMLASIPGGIGILMIGAAVVPCLIRPVALTVTPDIGQPDDTIWWRDGGDNTAVSVLLSLTQDPAPGRYRGGGTLTRGAATLEVYRDPGCQDPVIFDRKGEAAISHAELTSGNPFYLRGTSAGNVGLRLALDPPQDACVTVMPPAKRKIEVHAVNVITPILEVESLVLVDAGNDTYPTTRSQVTLSCHQSNPQSPCVDLRIALTHEPGIACAFSDEPDKIYPSGHEHAGTDLALVVTGLAAGPCELTLRLSSAGAQDDPSWHLEDPVSETVHVHELKLVPWRYLECGNTVATPERDVRLAARPKQRELHQHDPAGAFLAARVAIAPPADAFWDVASVLTLSVPPGLRVFRDDTCRKPVQPLKQADFGAGEVDVWVRATTLAPMDPQPPDARLDAVPQRVPDKVVTSRWLCCGATAIDGREVKNGEVVRFDTFSFDQHLDNKTANATGTKLATVTWEDCKHFNAVAIAGGDHYFDAYSRIHVNLQKEKAPHGGLFDAFRAVLQTPDKTDAELATLGTDFVATYLLNHKVTLHATTKELMRAYIEAVLGRAGVAGFSRNAGTPGTHAEVLAVDELLTAGLTLAEISVATYKIHPSGGRGKHFVACANCTGILRPDGPRPRVLTGLEA